MTGMQKSLMGQYHQDLLGVFDDPGLVIEKGNGCLLEDVNGKRYLDLLAGIAVNALGYAHPRWVKAVNE
ncbi:acetylornithine aminotransferase [Mycobacteroides abscessus subsp. abscessus]|nr:acetylornithine aminotransferase [Mycobacteroides abscessus subsp. abscessus]